MCYGEEAAAADKFVFQSRWRMQQQRLVGVHKRGNVEAVAKEAPLGACWGGRND